MAVNPTQLRQAQREVEQTRRELNDLLKGLGQGIRDLQNKARPVEQVQRTLIQAPSGSSPEQRATDQMTRTMKSLQDALNALNEQMSKHSQGTQKLLNAKAQLKQLKDQQEQEQKAGAGGGRR